MNLGSIIPFYSTEEGQTTNKNQLNTNIERLLNIKGMQIIAIINDSPEIKIDKTHPKIDIMCNCHHKGKTGAVNTGIQHILTQYPKVDLIIQSDFDLDQDSSEAENFLNIINSENLSNDEKFLIIGDRYTNPKNKQHEYRKYATMAGSVLSKLLGYNIKDITSGLRMYSSTLAENFLANTNGKGFSSDVDQLIISYLSNAKIFSHPLNNVATRADHTKGKKLVEVFQGILNYKKQLIERGKKDIVDALQTIINSIDQGEDAIIDLNPYGINKVLKYTNTGDDKYTLIPV